MSLRLSVLDQTPIPAGSSPTDALANTVDLARYAEALGYTRYWLAEHHGTTGLAGSAPEVLIAHVAAATNTIRVGSGGVMLSHYSPLKIAEQFRLLEALHPGRIDLGLGRAPGSEQLAALALQRNRQYPSPDDFIEQIAELVAWFGEDFPNEHPFRRLKATPIPEETPELWLLTSSSGYSARVAAHFGAGLCFAHFISAEGGPEAIAEYRTLFRSDKSLERGATATRASRSASSARRATRKPSSSRRADDCGASVSASTVDGAGADGRRGARLPLQARPDRLLVSATGSRRTWSSVANEKGAEKEVEALIELYGVDEVVIVTITHQHAARRRSYELLAELFELQPRA